MQMLGGFRPVNLGQRTASSVEMQANLKRLQRDAASDRPVGFESPEDFALGADYQPGRFANYMAV